MSTAQLDLRVHRGTDVLHRVVSICRRRQVEILALGYSGDRIRLVVQGDAARVRHLEPCLAALVDVRAVGVAGGARGALRVAARVPVRARAVSGS
jgi:acetolactate synthase regulatory subunit